MINAWPMLIGCIMKVQGKYIKREDLSVMERDWLRFRAEAVQPPGIPLVRMFPREFPRLHLVFYSDGLLKCFFSPTAGRFTLIASVFWDNATVLLAFVYKALHNVLNY